MVNWKVLLVVVVGVGFLAVGGLVGAFLIAGGGGSSGSPTDTPVDAPPPSVLTTTVADSPTPASTPTLTPRATRSSTPSPTASPTPTATVPPPTPTPTATAEPTPTGTPTPMDVRHFDAATVESELRSLLSDWRRDNGLSPFVDDGTPNDRRLRRMARNHSGAMAEVGKTIHEANGFDTDDRYEEFDLYHTCKYVDGQVYEPDNRFEALGMTYIGRTYQSTDGTTQYNENEAQAARALFESLVNNDVFSDRLSNPQLDRAGIGVAITPDNEVWVTVDGCAT